VKSQWIDCTKMDPRFDPTCIVESIMRISRLDRRFNGLAYVGEASGDRNGDQHVGLALLSNQQEADNV
jgi:hypothetical protein